MNQVISATVGGGFSVCVVDSGIDPARFREGAALLPGINLSGCGPSDDTLDGASCHGTSVALTIRSLAPKSPLVPVKVLDGEALLRDDPAIEKAFDWILEHRESRNIGIVCAAFALHSHYRSDYPYRRSVLKQQIAALREAGVITVAAAGNWYRWFHCRSEQGMAWPAILRETVSVGAVEFTTDGPRLTEDTQRLHPSVETGCHTTVFAEPGEPGGTSGAAATVAGRLAALREAMPGLKPDALTQELLRYRCEARDETGLAWCALSPWPVDDAQVRYICAPGPCAAPG